MGFAMSWLAVKGMPPEAVAQNLELTPTGEMADYGESIFTGRVLSSGWFLLVINQCEHHFVKPDSLAALSSDCEVIACSIEEHVMFCSSELWKNGTQIWRIEHDAQKSIEHISTSGSLPDEYPAIEKEFSEEQKKAGGKKADTDYYFEIPLQTAKSIVGFKHDEAGSDDENFEVFEGVNPSAHVSPMSDKAKKPWWKLW